MNVTRKLFSFLMVITILLGGFAIKPVPAKAIKNFTVEVTPATIGEVAEYKFSFTIEKELMVHDNIYFVFPPEVNVPEIPDWQIEENKDRVREIMKSIEIGGESYFPCGGVPVLTKLSDSSNEIKISNVRAYKPASNNQVKVTFKPKFGIKNPNKAGSYVFKVKTQREPTYFESQPVEIKKKTPEPKLKVEVTPATVGVKAEYKFQFTIEKPIRVHEYIKFNFPQGTTFTPPLPKNEDEKIKRLEEITKCIYFCADTTPHDYDSCKSLPYIISEGDGTLSIKIFSWLDLDPAREGYRDICMKITKEAGITNPGTPGAFTYRMATQAEPTGVESQPVLIKEKVSESKFIVEVTPNGAGEVAEYKFSFTTEKELYVHNRVYLVFPPEVFVPETPDTENKENHERIWEMMNNIEINGETYLSCGSIPRSKKLTDNSTELSLTTNHQRYIPGENDRVVIVFKPKFGIQNPKTPCNITFKVKTEWSDSTFMESQPVEIKEKTPEPKLKVEVAPNVVGEVAEYKFQFAIEKTLKVHEFIKMLEVEDTIN